MGSVLTPQQTNPSSFNPFPQSIFKPYLFPLYSPLFFFPIIRMLPGHAMPWPYGPAPAQFARVDSPKEQSLSYHSRSSKLSNCIQPCTRLYRSDKLLGFFRPPSFSGLVCCGVKTEPMGRSRKSKKFRPSKKKQNHFWTHFVYRLSKRVSHIHWLDPEIKKKVKTE